MHHFPHNARYWSKIMLFFITPCIWCPPRGVPVGILPWHLVRKKLEWWSYKKVKKLRGDVQPFRQNISMWQTDGQTSCHGIVHAMLMRRTVKTHQCTRQTLCPSVNSQRLNKTHKWIHWQTNTINTTLIRSISLAACHNHISYIHCVSKNMWLHLRW